MTRYRISLDSYSPSHLGEEALVAARHPPTGVQHRGSQHLGVGLSRVHPRRGFKGGGRRVMAEGLGSFRV